MLAVAFLEVQVVDAFSQSSAVDLLSPLGVVRQPRTFDANGFQYAAVANDPLFDVPVALPFHNGLKVTFCNDFFDEGEGVVVVSRPATAGHQGQVNGQGENQNLHV